MTFCNLLFSPNQKSGGKLPHSTVGYALMKLRNLRGVGVEVSGHGMPCPYGTHRASLRMTTKGTARPAGRSCAMKQG